MIVSNARAFQSTLTMQIFDHSLVKFQFTGETYNYFSMRHMT